ncbi:hypothetical protein [Bradyrhizobium sp. AZCC 2230]|uniref:hypothetical protein n=1 Tax=Bradyrhizobium sp. AZCC 2230 TaxID=3117021 RepID=UPI002FEE974A
MAKSSRQHIRRGGFVYPPHRYELHLANNPDDSRLDLVEMRRQITNLRSQHSDNLLVASRLNRFLVKIAFLSEPKDAAHEKHLRSEFERTLRNVEAIASRSRSAKPSGVAKQPK